MTLTTANIFNTIIKSFGLLFLKDVISEALTTISAFLRYFSNNSGYGDSIWVLFISLAVLALYAILCFQLLFKTAQIITLLKLDKGIEEPELSIEHSKPRTLTLSTTDMLTISLIIIGGYMLVSEIPDFIRITYAYFDTRKSDYSLAAPQMPYVLASAAKILIALLILGERKRIIGFIESRQG